MLAALARLDRSAADALARAAVAMFTGYVRDPGVPVGVSERTSE